MKRSHDLVQAHRGHRVTAILGIVPVILLVLSGCGAAAPDATERSAAPVATSPGATTAAADDARRVDLAQPTFSDPTAVTNPLFPIKKLTQMVQIGAEAGHPLRHDITLLPQTKTIEWNGHEVENLVSQFIAYQDGRLLEVAYDYFAQADDGSVWYFGEDVFNYKDGVIDNTDGTWLAGRDGPPGMIMPADPEVGDIYRPENIPELVFEEVTVKAVDQTVTGPSGPVPGGILVQERLLDGVLEDKKFAPGYGEFEASVPSEDELATAAVAVPTDARSDAAADQLAELSAHADRAFDAAAAASQADLAESATAAVETWRDYPGADAPSILATQLSDAVEALATAVDSDEPGSAQQAALALATASLDLRSLSEPVPVVDLARLEVWARQLVLDAGAAGAAPVHGADGFVLGDLAVIEAIWERAVPPADIETVTEVSSAIAGVQAAVDVSDLDSAAAAARQLSVSLRARAG